MRQVNVLLRRINKPVHFPMMIRETRRTRNTRPRGNHHLCEDVNPQITHDKKLEHNVMTYKATLFAAVLAAASLHFGGTAANAAPVGGFQQTVNVERPELQQVDWRPYRHCHRSHGRKWCHGGRRYGYSGYNPGFSLYIGRGHRHGHHRHHRRHHRH